MPTSASAIVLKIQTFASRPVAEQTRLRSALDALVATVLQPLPAAERIVLELPDGVAIAIISPGHPGDALALAERCQSAATDLPLCIGVNHGPVTPSTDAQRGAGLTGDGIATALIVAGAAQPGRFMVSRSFHEALQARAPGHARDLTPAGVFTDRNVRTHELFALDPQAAPARRRKLMLTGGLMVAGILGLGFAGRAVVQALLYVPPAIIKFNIKPGGEIYVDGILKGNTPPLQSLELKPGPHTVEIRNTTFPPLRMDIHLASKEETTITHTFERPRVPARVPRKPQAEPQEKSIGDHWRDLRRQMGL